MRERRNSAEPLTTGKVARYCHVTTAAVNKWIKSGKLKAYTTPGGHYRIERADFHNFLKKYMLPVQESLKRTGPKNVLITEDDDMMLEFLTACLKKVDENIMVHRAKNGYEACVKIGRFPVDLLLLDLYMPGMDGFQLLSILRSMPETRNLKIFVISGFLDRNAIEEITRMGVEDYLEKPFRVSIFKDKIRKILGITKPAEKKRKKEEFLSSSCGKKNIESRCPEPAGKVCKKIL